MTLQGRIEKTAEEELHVLWEAIMLKWSIESRKNKTVSDSLLEDIIKYYGEDETYRVLLKNSKLGRVLA